MKSLALTVTTLTLGLFLTVQSYAMPITGSISVSGGYRPINSSGIEVPLDIATGIDFFPTGGGGLFSVVDVSGDFSSLTPLITIGTITDFQFDPFTGPILDFWTVDEFAFDLENVALNHRDAITLSLLGTGTISHPRFDATPGNWVLTANSSGTTFSWSAGTAATPEPGTLALLATGIAGIGMRYKRRKRG